jgi:hypothetical protein
LPPLLARIIGAAFVLIGFTLIFARKWLGAWALRLRGEPPAQEGENRGYGAAFMVVGDVLIAVGALLLLGIVPQPR